MSTESKIDAYADIFVSGDALDRKLLAATAAKFIQIFDSGGSLEIVIKRKAENLTNKQKVLIFLLGRKILKDAGKLREDEDEGLTPSELEVVTHIAGNSLRPALKVLLEERLVIKEETRYLIPNYSLNKVSEALEEFAYVEGVRHRNL